MNNIGDAQQLAEYTLKETDWKVESEVFVQTINEALVYLTFPSVFNGKVYHIIDQVPPYTEGIKEIELTPGEVSRLYNKTILAFYSSCNTNANIT